MEKPYGYKESDVIALAEFIKGGEFLGKPLSEVFKEYAKKSGKSAGSVRNLYYALAKFSRENEKFTAEHLGGKPISVEKADGFSAEEERDLISKIQSYVNNGTSVRKATLLLAGGDAKLALRFQNKYRSVIAARATERTETVNAEKTTPLQSFLTERLKGEIDKLIDRLFLPVKQENFRLRRENLMLKSENDRLSRQIYDKKGRVLRYFERNVGAPESDVFKR